VGRNGGEVVGEEAGEGAEVEERFERKIEWGAAGLRHAAHGRVTELSGG
jgi:hypothetical protein